MVSTTPVLRRQQFHTAPAMSETKQRCNHSGWYSRCEALYIATVTHSELHTPRAQWVCCDAENSARVAIVKRFRSQNEALDKCSFFFKPTNFSSSLNVCLLIMKALFWIYCSLTLLQCFKLVGQTWRALFKLFAQKTRTQKRLKRTFTLLQQWKTCANFKVKSPFSNSEQTKY